MNDTEKAAEIVNLLKAIRDAKAEMKQLNAQIGRALTEIKYLQDGYDELMPKIQNGRLNIGEVQRLKKNTTNVHFVANLPGNLIALNEAAINLKVAQMSLQGHGLQETGDL